MGAGRGDAVQVRGCRPVQVDLAGPDWAVLTGREDLGFLAPGQCLLLRPDHIVAWRSPDPGAAEGVRPALLQGHPVLV